MHGLARAAIITLTLGATGAAPLVTDRSGEDRRRTPAADVRTLADLTRELTRHGGRPVAAYFWSPSMPLSLDGLPEARAAAQAIGFPFVAAEASVMEAPATLQEASLRDALVRSGATLHYPSLVVVEDGIPRGPAILGYKRATAWRQLLPRRLGDEVEGGVPPGPADARPPLPHPAAPSVPAEILWTHRVSPPPGAFFRRVPGTSLISYDQTRAVWLRDLASDRSFRGPGWIDFVPSPEGRLFVTPGPGNRGLEFYRADRVLAGGAIGDASHVEPFFVDPELADQYPSVGVLATDDAGRPTRYRVLVSWFRGLAFRDYDVTWGGDGAPDLGPAGPKRTACREMDLSTPILSKDGREVAARHEDTGTTKVFRLDDDGSCREALDLERGTSKVGFSADGRRIAYSAPDPAWEGRGVRSITYVLDRSTMDTREVPWSRSAGLVIPEIAGADSILIAVREDFRSRESEFRLIRLLEGGGAP